MAHAKGDVFGDACSSVCNGADLTPGDCQTFHYGKEVVFEAIYGGTEVFVKSVASQLDAEGFSRAWTLGEDGRRVYPDLNDFEVMVERYLKDNLGINLQV